MAMSGDFLVLVILVKTKYKWILVQSWFTLCTNVINVMGGAFRLWESISIWECISVMGGVFHYFRFTKLFGSEPVHDHTSWVIYSVVHSIRRCIKQLGITSA
jgi:hypothetical protein